MATQDKITNRILESCTNSTHSTKHNDRVSIFGYGITCTPLVQYLNDCGIGCDIYDDTFLEGALDSSAHTKEAQSKRESKSLDSAQSTAHNRFLPPSAFNPLESSLEICSPGILPSHKYFSKAQHIIGEYDFVQRLLDELLDKCGFAPQIVWISGTNGKTTTTQMLSFLLESYGAQAGGNIGTPLIELFKARAKLWILETSSFAMHYAKVAKPFVYLLLPLRQDHISWHGSFEAYIDDKLSVLARMAQDSSAFLPRELESHRFVKAYKGKAIFYTDSSDLAEFLQIDSRQIIFQEPFLLDSLLALCGAKIICGKCDIKRLNSFHIGAHRIEEFLDSKQWLWVDDSKGTNTDATLQAIKRYIDKRLYLILGGDDKGADCEPIFALLAGSKAHIFTIGKNEPKLLMLAKRYNISATACGTLQTAVATIKQERDKDFGIRDSTHKKSSTKDSSANGDSNLSESNRLDSSAHIAKEEFVGLLSPAAASLDQFKSYKERGELFKRYALES